MDGGLGRFLILASAKALARPPRRLPIETSGIVHTLYGFLAGLRHPGLTPFLSDWPIEPFETRRIPVHDLPVLSILPDLEDEGAPGVRPVIRALKAYAGRIRWGQTYSVDDFGPAFLERYGWGELIGQRGPVASRKIACGFLLLGPGTEYPLHSHEAGEAYVPLSGRALWVKGQEAWTRRPPGVPILHRPWTPHGMRTDSKPLLALYVWRGGDLAQKSRVHPTSCRGT